MPVIAFESTVFAHGLPSPVGVQTALRLEDIAREAGVEPRTIGIIAGDIIAGLSKDEIAHLANCGTAKKASVRDLPVATARRLDAATTVASTVTIAPSKWN